MFAGNLPSLVNVLSPSVPLSKEPPIAPIFDLPHLLCVKTSVPK